MASTTLSPTAPVTPSMEPPRRRYRREASMGQRCPQCAGPLVFGEGCHLCPVCGYSACGV